MQACLPGLAGPGPAFSRWAGLRRDHAPAPPCCAETGKKPHKLPVGNLVPFWQHANKMSETQNQSPFTRVAQQTGGAPKKQSYQTP
jgi:hypothetical protein